jgi:hypothetical protein
MFAILWAPWVLLSLIATKLLGRGYVGPVSATTYGWMTMAIYSTATASLLFPSFGKFKVTPKGGADEGGLRVLGFLRLLTAGAIMLSLATAARLLSVIGWLDLPAMPTFAVIATLLIAAFELTVIVLVLRSLARHRQRRSAYRFPVRVTARSHDHVYRVVDLNHHGAGLVVDDQHRVGEQLLLTMNLPGLDGAIHQVTVAGTIRSIREMGDGAKRAGLEFSQLTHDASHRILEYCHVLLPAQRAAAPRPAAVSDGAVSGASDLGHVRRAS